MNYVIKPIVEQVLDEVRTEIKDIAFDSQEIDGEHENLMVANLNDVLNIIDKYKTANNIMSPSEKEIAIEDKLEELSKRVDAIETQLKKDREEQLNKLKAQIELAKFNIMSCPNL